MATDDKHEYRKLLKIIDTTSTPLALANKLSDLAHEVEDDQIKKLCTGLAGMLRPQPGTKPTADKFSIRQMFEVNSRSSEPAAERRATYIGAAISYCDAMVAAATPAWHTIALRAGWTPPPNPTR